MTTPAGAGYPPDRSRDRVNEVDLVPGKEIRVAVEWPRRGSRKFVSVAGNGLFLHELERTATGGYVIRGLPDGPYTVRASCEARGKEFQAQSFVRAGGSVELTLEEK